MGSLWHYFAVFPRHYFLKVKQLENYVKHRQEESTHSTTRIASPFVQDPTLSTKTAYLKHGHHTPNKKFHTDDIYKVTCFDLKFVVFLL